MKSRAQLSPSQQNRTDKSVSKLRRGPPCYQWIVLTAWRDNTWQQSASYVLRESSESSVGREVQVVIDSACWTSLTRETREQDASTISCLKQRKHSYHLLALMSSYIWALAGKAGSTWTSLASSIYNEKLDQCQCLSPVYSLLSRKLNSAGWEVSCSLSSHGEKHRYKKTDPQSSHTGSLLQTGRCSLKTRSLFTHYQTSQPHHISCSSHLVSICINLLISPELADHKTTVEQVNVKATVNLLFGQVTVWMDTFIFLILRRLQQLDKLHIDVKLHSNNQGYLQEDQLQLLNA